MRQLALVFLVCTFTLTACAGLKTNQIVVAQDYYISVSLENFTSLPANLQLSHPYSLSDSSLKAVMQNISYRGATTLTETKPELPVFQEDEIERLAPELIEAVSLATNGQYVRFVSFNQGKGVLFNTSRKTEGILFVSSAGQLNIAFNFINEKRSASETSAMFHQCSPLNPIELTTSKTPLIATAPGSTIHPSADGSPSSSWIVADLDVIDKRVATQAASVVIHPTNDVQPTALQYVTTKSAYPAPVAQPTEEQKMAKIKKSLAFLKNLYEDGLISSEEYQARKQVVLDKIE